MAALTNLNNLVAKLTDANAEQIWLHKNSKSDTTTPALTAARWTSYWRVNGAPGWANANPGAVSIPTNTTNGGLQQADPGGGREKFLTGICVHPLTNGVIMVYDRLLHISGLSGTVITAQTVGGSITRNTGGVGNWVFAEIYTAIGGTARTITMNYTNQAGTSSQTSVATNIGGAGLDEALRMVPLNLAAGDYGVQAVASVTLSASTGTAGDFGITIARPLAMIPVIQDAGNIWDLIFNYPSIQKIDTDACIALAHLFGNSGTANPYLTASFQFLES